VGVEIGKDVTAYDKGADVGFVTTGYMIKTANIAAEKLKMWRPGLPTAAGSRSPTPSLSLFATSALEMVRTHLCYGRANVRLMAAYAGLSDTFDGPTHNSITDVAIMR
jgi:transketolase C-terminal domain/subunit